MKILLMYSTHAPSAGHIQTLENSAPDTEVVVAQDEPHAVKAARDAQIIFGHRYLRQVMPAAEKLQWVQSTAGGVDRLPLNALAEQEVMLTRQTVTVPDIARHALSMAWAVQKRLPELMGNQFRGQWERELTWLPAPEQALVLGTGSIGTEIATLLKREGMSVFGLKRDITTPAEPPFDRYVSRQTVSRVLPDIDWCFLAFPLNAGTRNFCDYRFMNLLPQHAVVVNVGRGETLVTADLRTLLNRNQLGGAALDVIHPKPSGPDDPIWQTRNLLITPHIAAHTRERGARLEAFAEKQLSRYLRGEDLENRVNLEKATV